MEKEYIISFFLDPRRKKSNQKFPVKIRLYHTLTKTAKLYPTNFEFTKKDFTGIWKSKKVLQKYHRDKLKLQTLENLLNEVTEKIKPFSFEQFERKYNRKKGEAQDVFFHYDQMISKFIANNQLGNAHNYGLSKKSLTQFLIQVKGPNASKLFFHEITPAWLNNYENSMLHRIKVKKGTNKTYEKPLSRSSISTYLRALRTVINTAIAEKDIDAEIYPFGRNKYQVPAVQAVKKALTGEQLNILYFSKPRIQEQEKAKDFWFFSYACNGMNIKDIANLRWENIDDDILTFYRAKTISTGKTHLKPVTVYITDPVRYVIEKYGNPDKNPKKFVFSILSEDQDEQAKYFSVKNFTRFVNQHIKNLAKDNGISGKISSYWARHSFATNAIRNGASMEFVSESLNHTNLRTTQGYFAGFEDKDKKDFMKSLMIFTRPVPKNEDTTPDKNEVILEKTEIVKSS